MNDPQEIKKETRGGYRAGAGRPKGAGKGSKQGRDAYWAQRVGEIKKRLSDAALGKVEMQPSQVKAAEVILDRHEPRLSSIEQTVHDPRDEADPALLAQKLAAMFDQKPELLDQVIALRSASNEKKMAQAEATHSVSH